MGEKRRKSKQCRADGVFGSNNLETRFVWGTTSTRRPERRFPLAPWRKALGARSYSWKREWERRSDDEIPCGDATVRVSLPLAEKDFSFSP